MKHFLMTMTLGFLSSQTFAAGHPVANSAFATGTNPKTWNHCVNIKDSQAEVYENSVVGVRKIFGPVAVLGSRLPWGGDDISSANNSFAFYELQGGGNELNIETTRGTLVVRRLVPVKSCPLK